MVHGIGRELVQFGGSTHVTGRTGGTTGKRRTDATLIIVVVTGVRRGLRIQLKIQQFVQNKILYRFGRFCLCHLPSYLDLDLHEILFVLYQLRRFIESGLTPVFPSPGVTRTKITRV